MKTNHWGKALLGWILALACSSASQLHAAGDAAPPKTTTTVTTTSTMTTMNPTTSSWTYEGCCLDDKIHARIGIPLWAFGMDGDIRIGNHEGHIDKDFWSFFDQLDFIAPIRVEVRQSRFFFYTEATYVKQTRDIEPRGVFASPSANGDLELKQLFAGINLGYELVRQPCYSLTAFAGGRMTYVKAILDFNGPLVSTSASRTKFIGDPVIGLYGKYDFNRNFGLYVKGDVGGFGLIGDHFTWQVEPGIDYRISPHTYARVAWRCLSIDFSKSNFDFDTQFMGPQAEFGWRW